VGFLTGTVVEPHRLVAADRDTVVSRCEIDLERSTDRKPPRSTPSPAITSGTSAF